MTGADFSLWVDALISLLVLVGALLALIGSVNVLRLPTFFQRLHAPALGATAGCACVVLATVTYFSFKEEQFIPQAIAIILFMALTTPMVTIFLMRAALFRERQSSNASLPAANTAETDDNEET
ncbi:monovalent cation/H(+) antiporter subunit G [Variovorax sp. HJSM1_2]|uniref:monovalent cation/H(+) antiporter subunit G n=1 Tax=Variovorax sp. HJSM1_2 TaxID=3366263 RepID=UPI003BCF661D